MSMGVFDSLKDWASKKLASTEFITYVEQATKETLLSPNYDMFMVLVDAANDPKGEWVTDVVRSVRIRLDNPNPKVKLFTLELASVLIQNCGLKLHAEVADQKGLLNAIVETACLRQDLVRGPLAEARKAAIQLIVNLDVWFKHHPSRDKTKPLAELIDEAKSRNCVFENVIPDTTCTIITEKYPKKVGADTHRSGQEILHAHSGVPNVSAAAASSAAQGSGVPNRGARNDDDGGGGGGYPIDRAPPARNRLRPIQDEVVIVEAIPVEEPNEERRSGMFETVMLLGEMYQAAVDSKESIRNNETITALATQVTEDFLFVSMLVQSGARLENIETLGSLYETQRTMLRQIREASGGGGGSSLVGVPSRATNNSSSSSSSAVTVPPEMVPYPAMAGTAGVPPVAATPSKKMPQRQPAQAPALSPGALKSPQGYHPATYSAPVVPPDSSSSGAKKTSTAPTLDELFSQAAPPVPGMNGHDTFSPAVAATTSSSSDAPLPSNVQLLNSKVTGGSSTSTNANNSSFPGNVQATVMNADGSPATARRSAIPEPRQNMHHGQANTTFSQAPELVELDEELHSPKEGPEPKPPQQQPQAPAGAPVTTRTAADTETDFDAFLNARLSIQNQ